MAQPTKLLAYIAVGQSLPTYEFGLVAANDAAQTTAFNNAKTSFNGQWAIISSAQSIANLKIVWARLYTPIPQGYPGFTQPDPTDADNEFGYPSGVVPAPLYHEDILGAPVVASATRLHAAVTLTGSPQTLTYATLTHDIDVTRQLSFTLAVNSQLGHIAVSGKDFNGLVTSETIIPDGIATVFTTANAYAPGSVSIVLPAKTNSSGDTIAIGVTGALGLPRVYVVNSIRAAYLAGVLEATAPTVTTNSTIVAQNLITLSSALNSTGVRVDSWYP